MLIIVSAIHLGAGTCGKSILASAFRLFTERLGLSSMSIPITMKLSHWILIQVPSTHPLDGYQFRYLAHRFLTGNA